MTQAGGQGVRSRGEHVPACARTRLSLQGNTALHGCYVQKRDRTQRKKCKWALSEHASAFGWIEGWRKSKKWVNDELGPASQSHFLNVLYPKSYKSNIPFLPYWGHFCKAITSVSLGIWAELCLGFFFLFPFFSLPFIFTLSPATKEGSEHAYK